MIDIHKFMVAVSGIEVNHDGNCGTDPDAMTWDKAGGSTSLTRPPFVSSLTMLLCKVHLSFRTALGVACLRLSSLRRMSLSGFAVSKSFLASLHWPRGAAGLGGSGVSYLEFLSMFEQSAGQRFFAPIFGVADPLLTLLFPSLPPSLPPLFPFLLPPSSGNEIRQGCQFIRGLFRSLGHFPRDLTRFIPSSSPLLLLRTTTTQRPHPHVTSFTCAPVSSVTVSAPHFRTLPQGPRVSSKTVFSNLSPHRVIPIRTLRTQPTLVAEQVTALFFVDPRVTASPRRTAESGSSRKRRDLLAIE